MYRHLKHIRAVSKPQRLAIRSIFDGSIFPFSPSFWPRHSSTRSRPDPPRPLSSLPTVLPNPFTSSQYPRSPPAPSPLWKAAYPRSQSQTRTPHRVDERKRLLVLNHRPFIPEIRLFCLHCLTIVSSTSPKASIVTPL